MVNSDFLGTERVGKLFFRLSLPMVFAQAVNMLYNLVDRIYIGHISTIGATALTGLGVCFPILTFVSAFAALAATGGASRASMAMGRRENGRAETIMANSLSLLIIIGALLTAILLIFHRPLLYAFGASDNTIGYASSYVMIYALGTIAVEISIGMNSFISAQGFTRVSMLSVLIGAILNIALDPLFIFVFNMGVSGAALATIISQIVSAVWVLSFLCSSRSTLRLQLGKMKLNRAIALSSLSLGVGPFIMQATGSFVSIAYNSSALRYGGDIAVGAMTILSSILQFTSMPTSGFGQGAQPIISYSYGSRDKKRVKESFMMLLRVDLIYTFVVWALVMLFPAAPVSLFTSDPALLEYAIPALRVFVGTLCIFGIQMACQNTFIAIGESHSAIAVAVMRKLILIIPLIYILPHIFTKDRTMAVIMAEPLSDLLSVTFCVVIFSYKFKRALRALDKNVEE